MHELAAGPDTCGAYMYGLYSAFACRASAVLCILGKEMLADVQRGKERAKIVLRK